VKTKTRKQKLLDRFEAAVRDGDHPFPLGRLLGFHLASVEPGEAVIELEAKEHHSNPMGTLHGGVLCAIADSAMGVAHASMIDEHESSTTLELKINFLRPVWTGKLRAVGRVVKQGKTISLMECDVLDEKDNLVARASSTCMTLRGEQARGR
jgi:uncharacterized protein (TIGR00369 family)